MSHLKDALVDATISVCMMPKGMRPPELQRINLRPEYWEQLRQRLQATYRLATGERNAILHVEYPSDD